MTPPPLDLLIVGAGPVGLSTAVAALHRGVNRILVVDQARELRPVGQTLDLLPNAVRFVSALSPQVRPLLDPFIQIAPPGKKRAKSMTTRAREFKAPVATSYGELVTIAWWQLQRVLIDALPNSEIIILNHQFEDYTYDEDGLVCAQFIADRVRENIFKNWDGDYDKIDDYLSGKPPASEMLASVMQPVEQGDNAAPNGGRRVTIKTKMLVGADGINSVVRKCLYRECGPGWEQYTDPIYSGFTRVGAKVGHEVQFDSDAVDFMDANYLGNALMVILTCDEDKISPFSPRAMIAHPSAEFKAPFNWVTNYFLPIDEDIIKSSSNRQLTHLALQMLREANYPEQLLRISAKAWQSMPDDEIAVRKHYTVPATHPIPYSKPPTMPDKEFPPDFERPWYRRRVIIIGDAAHAAPNFLAQGAAMGIEDAYELVIRIAASGIWEKGSDYVPTEQELERIFDAYQRARLDRVCYFQSRTIARVPEFDVDAVTEVRQTLYAYQPLKQEDVVL